MKNQRWEIFFVLLFVLLLPLTATAVALLLPLLHR